MQEYLFEEKTYYRKNEFKSNRLTLVFAHGVSGSSSAWLPYEKKFAEKYNVLFYDIRGHGKSKKFPNYSDYEVKNFVDDLHELVTFLKIKKFVLITNSFAALIAVEYIKKYRENVIASIFTSPEIYLKPPTIVKFSKPALKILTGLISVLPFNPKPRGHVDYKKYIGSTDWSPGRNLADMRNTGLRAHFYTLRQSMQAFEHDLEKINIPTLVIHGEKDTMIPLQNSKEVAKRIKNAEFISIPNVDHNTVHNAVKFMSEAIESFVEKNKKVLQ
ncbi:MAG: alpha/beta hydrolase [bacterium]